MNTRRQVIQRAAAMMLLAPLARGASAQVLLTPAQTEGPFYPTRLPEDTDGDLVKLRGNSASAAGAIIHVSGIVRDPAGRPLAGARVELWQADARGIYRHPRAPDTAQHDAAFQGYGAVRTDAQGRYAFRTIRPGRYPGRTPHLHLKVAPATRVALTTQMYFADEPGNADDGLWRYLSAPERRAVTVALDPAPGIEPGARAGTFDLTLAG